MARLNDTVSRALGYWWNLIYDFANAGLSVTDTISAANDIAREAGTSLSFGENTAISQLFGYARGIINAGDVFQQAEASLGITSEMIALAPYARDEAEMTTSPIYNVKFEYTYIDSSGNIQVGIRTSVFDNGLPATAGQLTADVLDDAEAMAAKYGHTLISAVPLQILAV
jgi:hypothetical protein